ncbi:hypothetical protein [Winogradskyella pacifica]|uniref:Uncharacterized protein n=1 Tax=Winogradskyella pacifica TaxID=664642 RepID=A0A3D9N313_9FLAO|nr:hypothetical protein [Winogradskyella pacifica]REE24343.1 hypothetical protein DFQ09_104114 [Winogradskyella pacifica]
MEKGNKELEAFIEKIMSTESLEQPSVEFTDNIMSKVKAISNSKTIVYKPLIPTYIWIVIIGSFLWLVGCIYLNESVTSVSWLERFTSIKKVIDPLATLTFGASKILIYTVVLFTVMLSIQIPLLKQYFNKRMMVFNQDNTKMV